MAPPVLEASQRPSSGHREMPTKNTVLIIDDERNVRESLGKVFRNAGYETLLAANGAEAAELHAQHRPDVVLLDLNMPVRNGWETFEQISTLHPLTPVIIITGRPGQFELAAAARVGALMEKPLDPELLLETTRRLVDEPLSARLSRLAFQQPHTAFIGSRDPREIENDPTQITALLRLRKAQLDELRDSSANRRA